MQKIINIFPANDFSVVAKNAAAEIEAGIIIGYDKDGYLCVFGGGLIDRKQPVCKDWLWMVETFKNKLINGNYAGE